MLRKNSLYNELFFFRKLLKFYSMFIHHRYKGDKGPIQGINSPDNISIVLQHKVLYKFV